MRRGLTVIEVAEDFVLTCHEAGGRGRQGREGEGGKRMFYAYHHGIRIIHVLRVREELNGTLCN